MCEAQGITWSDGIFHSKCLNKSPGELAFQIDSSSQLGQKLFVALERKITFKKHMLYFLEISVMKKLEQ